MSETERSIHINIETDSRDSVIPSSEWRERVSQILDNSINRVANSYRDSILNQSFLSSALDSIVKVSESNSKLLAQFLSDNITSALEALARFCTEFVDAFFPNVSQAEKEQLIASYKEWGRLGWTCPLDAPVDFLDKPPGQDTKQAHAYIMSMFRGKHGMDFLFKDLFEYYPHNSDIQSACFCFEHRQYKACALLLFGLIDGFMIRWLKRRHIKEDDLPVGIGAIRAIQVKTQKLFEEQEMHSSLHTLCLFTCLTELFKNTNNFKLASPTINRNYVSHGMSKKPVRKRDCIQLFLVLNNLNSFL